jgi:hypothetical protein
MAATAAPIRGAVFLGTPFRGGGTLVGREVPLVLVELAVDVPVLVTVVFCDD